MVELIRASQPARYAASAIVVLCIFLRVLAPPWGKVFERENCCYRTYRYAGATIDTFNWINVELRVGSKAIFILSWVDAIHRAGIHTGGVFHPNTWFCNNVCHVRFPLHMAGRQSSCADPALHCRIGYRRQRVATGERVNQGFIQSAIPRFYPVLGHSHGFFNLNTLANAEIFRPVLF